MLISKPKIAVSRDLAGDNTHLTAIVLFRFSEGPAGEPVANISSESRRKLRLNGAHILHLQPCSLKFGS